MKFQIKNDNDAINLSVIMRKNLHHVLTIFSLIAENNGEAFLKMYLHPEYAKFDYEFTNFDPLTGEFKAKQFPVDTKNTQSNAERYIRVSFESLKEYATKENRRSIAIKNKSTIDDLEKMLTYIRKKDYPTANKKLKNIINEISTFLVSTP